MTLSISSTHSSLNSLSDISKVVLSDTTDSDLFETATISAAKEGIPVNKAVGMPKLKESNTGTMARPYRLLADSLSG